MVFKSRDQLRMCASEAAFVSSLLADASEASLFSKVAALEACKANPYQPALLWHPTIFGSMMQLDLRDRVSQEIFLTGAFEPDVLWLMSCLVNEGETVIDGGGHIGFFSIALAHLVGENGCVDVFEPSVETRKHLDTNVRNSGFNHVHVHETALWSRSGTVDFNEWGAEFSAYNGITAPRLNSLAGVPTAVVNQVPTTSIDEFVTETGRIPSFIKLDVESAEHQVLLGAKDLLELHRPLVLFEIGDFANSQLEEHVERSFSTLQLMERLSYAIFDLSKCRLVPQLSEDRSYSYGNVLAVPMEDVENIITRTNVG
ncbi:FkbM family methyltransferase [Agrobacterium rosae]|uniref:FkbM family methyltransferase n=1 Tax=Agrobacterium rosae TaxID=1972867 RepID=UPI000CD7F51F|nr:FkbM family methyltransferase [Agrobacterium rosae]POO48795.1 hypothetical protein CTT39_24270 [Agrobacterium rosae]